MTDLTPRPDRTRRLRRQHLAWSLVAVAVVVALALAGLGRGGAPDRKDDPSLTAEAGPGRAIEGDGGDLEAVDATAIDASSAPDSTVDTDPGVTRLQKV